MGFPKISSRNLLWLVSDKLGVGQHGSSVTLVAVAGQLKVCRANADGVYRGFARKELERQQRKSFSQAFQRLAGDTKLVPLGSPRIKPLPGDLEDNALQHFGGQQKKRRGYPHR